VAIAGCIVTAIQVTEQVSSPALAHELNWCRAAALPQSKLVAHGFQFTDAASYFGHASSVVIRHSLNCSAPTGGTAGIFNEPLA
jgi:hypothetical protein